MDTTLPDPHAWRAFVSRTAASLGTLAVVSGAVYLVAWNWAGLGRGTKLGLAAAAVVGAAALATAIGLDRLPGRLAGAASCGFAGALLVLVTQVYQVGADPWELFAGFAALTVPYALATRLLPLAAVGAVAAQVSAILAHTQLRLSWPWFSAVWTGVHVLVLLALHARWPGTALPRVTAILAVGLPTVVALEELIDGHGSGVALAAFAAVFVGAHLLRRDVLPAAWAVACASAVAAAWVGRETFDTLEHFTWLLLAVLLGVFGAAAAAWLRFLHRRST